MSTTITEYAELMNRAVPTASGLSASVDAGFFTANSAKIRKLEQKINELLKGVGVKEALDVEALPNNGHVGPEFIQLVQKLHETLYKIDAKTGQKIAHDYAQGMGGEAAAYGAGQIENDANRSFRELKKLFPDLQKIAAFHQGEYREKIAAFPAVALKELMAEIGADRSENGVRIAIPPTDSMNHWQMGAAMTRMRQDLQATLNNLRPITGLPLMPETGEDLPQMRQAMDIIATNPNGMAMMQQAGPAYLAFWQHYTKINAADIKAADNAYAYEMRARVIQAFADGGLPGARSLTSPGSYNAQQAQEAERLLHHLRTYDTRVLESQIKARGGVSGDREKAMRYALDHVDLAREFLHNKIESSKTTPTAPAGGSDAVSNLQRYFLTRGPQIFSETVPMIGNKPAYFLDINGKARDLGLALCLKASAGLQDPEFQGLMAALAPEQRAAIMGEPASRLAYTTREIYKALGMGATDGSGDAPLKAVAKFEDWVKGRADFFGKLLLDSRTPDGVRETLQEIVDSRRTKDSKQTDQEIIVDYIKSISSKGDIRSAGGQALVMIADMMPELQKSRQVKNDDGLLAASWYMRSGQMPTAVMALSSAAVSQLNDAFTIRNAGDAKKDISAMQTFLKLPVTGDFRQGAAAFFDGVNGAGEYFSAHPSDPNAAKFRELAEKLQPAGPLIGAYALAEKMNIKLNSDREALENYPILGIKHAVFTLSKTIPGMPAYTPKNLDPAEPGLKEAMDASQQHIMAYLQSLPADALQAASLTGADFKTRAEAAISAASPEIKTQILAMQAQQISALTGFTSADVKGVPGKLGEDGSFTIDAQNLKPEHAKALESLIAAKRGGLGPDLQAVFDAHLQDIQAMATMQAGLVPTGTDARVGLAEMHNAFKAGQEIPLEAMISGLAAAAQDPAFAASHKDTAAQWRQVTDSIGALMEASGPEKEEIPAPLTQLAETFQPHAAGTAAGGSRNPRTVLSR